MDAFIEAIKSNDLIKAKKAFGSIMSERTVSEIEEMRIALAKSIMIEGEEESDDEDSEEKEDKKPKEKSEKDDSDDDSDEDDE
ncbi:prohead core protein [Yersinia phage MHG19]|nr:prohead core protein [Yersinia phage MHG19]